MSARPRIAVSSCLLGQPVRYDGKHKKEWFISELLAPYFELIAVCPEADLGVPRPAVQLVAQSGAVRAVGVKERSLDVTKALEHYSQNQLKQWSQMAGFICKARSPSCGWKTTPLYDPNGRPQEMASGLFAQRCIERYPRLPIIDEDGIADPDRCEAFLHRVWAADKLG